MQFKISCLLFLQDKDSRILLLQRKKPPNLNLWSPPGGKLEMSTGESPFECAKREALEEVGVDLADQDLNLFGYVSEKNYEGKNHWLMFLFEVIPLLGTVPRPINEGCFKFFSRSEIDLLQIPQTDHKLVWPFYDKRGSGFWGIRADFNAEITKIMIEANPNSKNNR